MGRTLGLVLGLLMALAAAGGASAESLLFDRPAALEPRVAFWKRIYTEVDTRQGLVHDSVDLAIVYETLSFPAGLSTRARERRTRRARERVQAVLRGLASGRRSGLSDEERRVLASFPAGVSDATLRKAAGRVRFQLGQADKFRAGLVRMGRWEDYIRSQLLERGLPAGLVALPHVESSFNPRAVSHAGASGIWQFTRSTGRRFMRVDHVVDERRDPFLATVAAARLLKQNYEITKSWPLAITAYNHGAAGMRRAVRKLGTRDISRILDQYQSRSFGFASRNFYCEFLAALDVELDFERYFGPIQKDAAENPEIVVLDHFYRAKTLAQSFGLGLDELRAHNPALLGAVWDGHKLAPQGYGLRLPRSPQRPPALTVLAGTAPTERFAEQIRDRRYRVRRGDTIGSIARRFHVSQAALVRANGLRSRHRIRVGQVLELPGKVGVRAPALAAAETTPVDGIYQVRRGDSIATIARRFGVDQTDLVALNRLRNPHQIAVGQRLQLPGGAASAVPPNGHPGAAGVYTVRRGDSLRKIAQRYGVREAEIVALNRLGRPDRIHPGQVLHLPAGHQAGSAAAAPVPSVAQAEPVAEPFATPGAAPSPESQREPTAELPAPEPPAALAATLEPATTATPPAASDASAASAPALGLPLPEARYAVAADGSIEVLPDETLGHYAEWLEIGASALRRKNGLRPARPLPLGRRMRLDLARVPAAEFEARRLAHHRALQQRFFGSFRVAGTREYVLRPGDTLWEVAKRHEALPVWLLLAYNPELDAARLRAGQRLLIPQVVPSS